MQAQPRSERDPLATLVDMAHRARHVADLAELDFLAVNGSHALAPYRQAALWFEDRKVCALSGVVQIEANAPYVQWVDQVCRKLQAPGPVDVAALPDSLAQDWPNWLPAHGLWLPLELHAGQPERTRGGILLARELPWMAGEIALLTEWADILSHAYAARRRPQPWRWSALKSRIRQRLAHERQAGLALWRRRWVQAAAVLAIVLLFPVRLSILAPGELVPADPATIRAPLDGVIETFHVAPNQLVKKEQPLFDFDRAQLAGRYAVASQALATAEAEYRQALQQALADGKSKAVLAVLQGKIEERRAETEFLRGQVERAQVTAPRDGVVLFDDPSAWLGRPVATGERVMRIAAVDDVEIEAWLAVGDAVPLQAGAPATLYLSASPLSPVDASVRYLAYEAVQRPDGTYAYRVRAAIKGPTDHRVGLKGTVKLAGSRVPLVYWVLRRPLAALRQMLGW